MHALRVSRVPHFLKPHTYEPLRTRAEARQTKAKHLHAVPLGRRSGHSLCDLIFRKRVSAQAIIPGCNAILSISEERAADLQYKPGQQVRVKKALGLEAQAPKLQLPKAGNLKSKALQLKPLRPRNQIPQKNGGKLQISDPLGIILESCGPRALDPIILRLRLCWTRLRPSSSGQNS